MKKPMSKKAPKPPKPPAKGGKSYQDTKLPSKAGATGGMKKSCSCGKKPCVCRGG